MRDEDLAAVLELNRDHEEMLSPLTAEELVELVDLSLASWVAEQDGAVVGFAICMAPGAPYASANYRWFSERYDDFVYLDRIAVDGSARRLGVGGALYDELAKLAAERGGPTLCEVNVVPPNEPSLAFHAARGFEPVGELEHDGGKVVRMLAR